MAELERSTAVAAPAAESFAWLTRAAAFARLVPPWEGDVGVASPGDGALEPGMSVPVGRGWLAKVRELEPEARKLTLEQGDGPFATYNDELRVEQEQPAAGGGDADAQQTSPQTQVCRIIERVNVTPDKSRQVRRLKRMLAHRHEQARRDLERLHAAGAQQPPPLCIAITGATGFLGTPLVAMLAAAGHRVMRVTRRPKHETDIGWDPSAGQLDAERLEGVDAVIHLAGENPAQRWTQAAKQRIFESRVEGTTLLARTLASLKRKPAVLLSCSATGYYGDTGEKAVDESAAVGAGFLPQVCAAWEQAAQPAREAGIRVVHPRIGVVLGLGGGALAKLLPVVRLGLGGPLGSGRQYMPWIGRDDVLGALWFLLHHEQAHGPVNLVAPQPKRNRDVVRTLGRMLRRPTWLPAPAPAIKLFFGEMGRDTVLASQHVRPSRLEELGFTFQSPSLEAALAFELGTQR